MTDHEKYIGLFFLCLPLAAFFIMALVFSRHRKFGWEIPSPLLKRQPDRGTFCRDALRRELSALYAFAPEGIVNDLKDKATAALEEARQPVKCANREKCVGFNRPPFVCIACTNEDRSLLREAQTAIEDLLDLTKDPDKALPHIQATLHRIRQHLPPDQDAVPIE